MQTVPSLVGTGTAVAAAASGLVFGQPPPTTATATVIVQGSPARSRRSSHQKTISVDHALDPVQRPSSVVHPRPLSTSAAPPTVDDLQHRSASRPRAASRPPLSRRQRPQSSRATSPRSFARKSSSAKPGDPSPHTPSVATGDSACSNGSWMRRLSIRPQSQSNSARSSLVADSTSAVFSHGSLAPVLVRSGPTAPPLPPNKLVKRLSSTQNGGGPGDASTRWRTSRHLPTLRRPATSHQRSATLQQFRADTDVAGSAAHPKYSFEQPIWPQELLDVSPFGEQFLQGGRADSVWSSYFHSRTRRIPTSSSVVGRHGDANPLPRDVTSKRICPEGSYQNNTVLLIKPIMIPKSPYGDACLAPAQVQETSARPPSQAYQDLNLSAVPAAPTRTRRSLSGSFSSATSWVSKRSSSLRRPKRAPEQPTSASLHDVAEPAEFSASHSIVDHQETALPSEPSTGTSVSPGVLQEAPRIDSATTTRHHSFVHHGSQFSPPPSHSIVVNGVGSWPRPAVPSRDGTTRYGRPNQPSGSSTSSTVLSHFARGSLYDRSSFMESSDGDTRGFTSGDDDDFDFKSDTMFDSIRTLSSCRARAVETLLESVYDESPPSTAGNGRTNRLSVQEMLARSWDDGNKILEEDDESTSTPVRAAAYGVPGHPPNLGSLVIVEPHSSSESPHDDVARMTKDLEQCSLDGFDDEDWTRDNEMPFNSPLSPPSKVGSSPSSKGMNPKVRLALASIEGQTLPRTNDNFRRVERPLSNLFEWSETSMHEGGGTSMRPRTAYAMPAMDSRGGRSAMRRGPTPTHVWSQSVPVVHDFVADAKPTGSKYGTWGMAAKTVSEDWDEDFEFGAGGGDCNGEAAGKSQKNAFAVPESIRATQPSVRAHSGQIRELSLLVNDLKRLCRHGRELNMLNAEHAELWREAEGIIALASPDEDDVEDEDQSLGSAGAGSLEVKGLPLETKRDAATLDHADAAFDSPEPAMRETAVVRERQSPRRRSIFSPEDDIFGGEWPLMEPNGSPPSRVQDSRTPVDRASPPGDVSGVVLSVMESMRQHPRCSAGPPRESRPVDVGNGRVQFDTNSLKALVKKAGELRDILSDTVRRADQITQSPAVTPRRERRLDSSPAFTRVFDGPGLSPLRRAADGRGTGSMTETTPSSRKPPSSSVSPRTPLMMSAGPA